MNGGGKMSARSNDVAKYISFLNLEVEAPSYAYLERICQAHLNTFPFENISKLLYFRDHNYGNFEVPSFEKFIRAFENHHYGGTCYTLNSNFMILLKKLGFTCYHIMLGKEHMGIIVTLGDERFYVDCGATAPFFKPARFESGHENRSSFGNDEVYLLPVDSENNYKYMRFMNGKQSGKTWNFHSRREVTMDDFLQVIETSNKPGATFMSILRCHLYQTDQQRSVSLVNNKFTIRYSNGETTVTTLFTPEEIRSVIADEFNLPKLPVLEAVNVLKELDVDIFAE